MSEESREGLQKRAKLEAGRAWLEIVALSPERLVLEIFAPHAAVASGPIASFTLEFENLEKVLNGDGSFQAETNVGSLMARSTRDQVWFVYEVISPRVQDSCLIPKEDLNQALQRLQNPSLL